MAGIAVIFGVLAIASAALIHAAGRGRIGRNWAIGIRLRATLRDDDAWLAGHDAATRPMWVGTAVVTVLSLATLFTRDPLTTILTLVTLGVLIGTLAIASIVAVRAAERVPAGGRQAEEARRS